MTFIGLDLNTSRARAVRATARTQSGIVASPVLLEDAGHALPLALYLEARQAVVGTFAASRARREPHLVCSGFLPHLGHPRQWTAGRHRLDASAAMRMVLDALTPRFGVTDGVAGALPDYLSAAQVGLLAAQTQKLRWKLLGSIPTSLAATLAAHSRLPWSGTVLVLDADEYALSCSAVIVEPGRITRLAHQHLPALGTTTWLRRMLDGTAQRCIRISRRDPRDCAEADQSLYLQLQRILERPPVGDDFLSLALNSPHWSQHLMLRPTELLGFCLPLVQQALDLVVKVHDTMLATPHAGPLAGILMTPLAAGLPGLYEALQRSLDTPMVSAPSEDLGEGLLQTDALTPQIHVLHPDDLAQAAVGLAEMFRNNHLAQGHRETVPIPRRPVEDRGPARLRFQGRDYQLGQGVFTIGRNLDCTLPIVDGQYPSVSTHHCDILHDQQSYLLRDHSQLGTLVNERLVRLCLPLHSGDRIRLGPMGPVLQFLGV